MRPPLDRTRLGLILAELARVTTAPTTLYLVGGSTALEVGWRPTTVDLDLVIEPERDEILRSIPELKERLDVNVEFASPLDFLPELPGWRDRSTFVNQIGDLTVRQFDPYSQALAKLERGFDQDRQDVDAMVRRGMVEPSRLLELFDTIAPELFRFPVVDPIALARAVDKISHSHN
jgi:hypothetical protein